METKDISTNEIQNRQLPLTQIKWLIGIRCLLFICLVVISFLAFSPLEYQVVSTGGDKLNHLAAFFVLGLLLDYSFPIRPFGWLKFSALMFYGLGIEVIQNFLPYRFFSLLDWVADFAGICGYLISIPLLKKIPLLRARW